MAKLNERVKKYIVQELACFRTPTEVAKAVGEEFGVEITRNQAYDYHPYGTHADRVSKKWREIYDATRAEFLKQTADIPAANKAYRLRELSEAAQRAKARGNLPLMAQLLEQAAKECGDAFTNRHKVEATGKDGQALFQVFMHPDAVAESQE